MGAYIIDGVRTPIGSYKGTLSTVRTDDLGALVIAEVVKRNPNIPKEAYDDVIIGCANQAGEDNRNVARMSALLAGLPETVSGTSINRLCGSGMDAGNARSRMWMRCHAAPLRHVMQPLARGSRGGVLLRVELHFEYYM